MLKNKYARVSYLYESKTKKNNNASLRALQVITYLYMGYDSGWLAGLQLVDVVLLVVVRASRYLF